MVPVVAFGEISGTHNLDMTKASKLSPPARLAKTVRLTGRRWQNYLPIGITLAQRLCDQAAAGLGDDRAVVTIWRS